MFDSLFGGGASDAEDAFNKAMRGYEDMILKYYQPFIDNTFSQMDTLTGEYSKLLTNPAAVYDMMAMGFETSPGYEFQYNQAMNAQNQAAAAGGMLGTPQHQQYSAGVATGLAQQDYANYMASMETLYGKGLSGTEDLHRQNFTTGYNASVATSEALGNQMMAEAQMAAKTAQAESDFMGQLMGLGMAAMGGMIFGPAGASIGASLGSAMFGGGNTAGASTTGGGNTAGASTTGGGNTAGASTTGGLSSPGTMNASTAAGRAGVGIGNLIRKSIFGWAV